MVSTRGIQSLLWLGAGALGMVAGMSGCGTAETQAEFMAGDDVDALDGATIADDGSTFELDMDDSREVLARVDIDGGKRYIEFDPALSEQYGLPVPSSIGTAGNTLEVDPSSGVATLTVEVPFQGMQTFTFDGGDALSLFGLETRAPQQQLPPCARNVVAVDEFCELFQTNAPGALQDVIDLALQFSAEAGVPDIANGFIEEVVTDFYDVLEDFCDAWTEVRDGSSTKAPVDPCDM